MDLATALDFARPRRRGVLTTVKRDGRPQLSNVTYAFDDGGRLTVMMGAARAKYANLVRDPRCSLHVTSDDFRSYVVLEGDAQLAPPSAAPDDETVEHLVGLYRTLSGEHPDWDEYRAAMVDERSTVMSLQPAHAYGLLRD